MSISLLLNFKKFLDKAYICAALTKLFMLQKLKINSAKKVVEEKLLSRRPKAIKTMQNIGVIIDAEVLQNLQLEDLKKAFQSFSGSVSYIILSEKEIEGEKVVKKKDLAWKASFKPETAANEFQQQEFDLLINYFKEVKPELFILSGSTSAKLKTGFSLEEKQLNDLEINVKPEEVSLFTSEVKKYLSIINQ
ncbi:MAG: hypothetical protein CMH15_02400 [Mesonia sp.]|nr:hypothetical protein [Mesonia sp.]MAQ39895.1 hypothetical protein [Mesonia sp.]